MCLFVVVRNLENLTKRPYRADAVNMRELILDFYKSVVTRPKCHIPTPRGPQEHPNPMGEVGYS
jgi:hypothetical protein